MCPWPRFGTSSYSLQSSRYPIPHPKSVPDLTEGQAITVDSILPAAHERPILSIFQCHQAVLEPLLELREVVLDLYKGAIQDPVAAFFNPPTSDRLDENRMEDVRPLETLSPTRQLANSYTMR